ncbi:unnamed protein product, partial [Echinostoma caproni]|uniref:TACO1 oxidase n=1 Tax=Echinostoma caproni TaxID=27848 RepID=A0A183ATX6_9TREM
FGQQPRTRESLQDFKTSRLLPGATLLDVKRFAGHSHWQNVKHTKEANDRAKARTLSFVKAGGGVRDPKLNEHLAAVLAEAKANSVPSSTLQRVLNAENTTDPYIIEVQAQGGLFILIESCAYPVNPERQRLSSIVKRYGLDIFKLKCEMESSQEAALISVSNNYY